MLISSAFGLEPNEILIIANSNCSESIDLANYYCLKRRMPKDHIIVLQFEWPAGDTVAADYVKKLAAPMKRVKQRPFQRQDKVPSNHLWCADKSGGRAGNAGYQKDIDQLKMIEHGKIDKLADILSQLNSLGIENPPAPISNTAVEKCSARLMR